MSGDRIRSKQGNGVARSLLVNVSFEKNLWGEKKKPSVGLGLSQNPIGCQQLPWSVEIKDVAKVMSKLALT